MLLWGNRRLKALCGGIEERVDGGSVMLLLSVKTIVRSEAISIRMQLLKQPQIAKNIPARPIRTVLYSTEQCHGISLLGENVV